MNSQPPLEIPCEFNSKGNFRLQRLVLRLGYEHADIDWARRHALGYVHQQLLEGKAPPFYFEMRPRLDVDNSYDHRTAIFSQDCFKQERD